MAENNQKKFRSPWPDEYFEQTSEQERGDEMFRERVAICLEDGNLTLEESIVIARAELRNHLSVLERRFTTKAGRHEA